MCRGLPLDGPGVPALGPASKSSQSRSAQRPQLYDDDFLVYTYKVVPCDKTWRHDFSSCPFSHPGESSERRHPSTYLPFMCGSTQHSTDLKEKCPFGTSCKYAHGHFELWLHPGRFRTKLCSLGENCKRHVCFFAHSEQELRVTPYSKLETGAAAATQQLAQMGQQLDGNSNCSSLAADSVTASSIRSSSDGSELKSGTCALLSSPCGSEAGHSLMDQPLHNTCSPCGSVVCEDAGNYAALTAGMVLNTQAAMLEMQLQNSNLLAAAANDAAIAASAPSMWLAGSNMLPQQLPLAYGGLLPQQQQQLVYLDAAYTGSQVMTYTPAAELVAGNWVLPAVSTAAAPAAARLADQWATSSMLVQQQQRPAAYGMPGLAVCNPVQMQGLPVPNMLGNNTGGMDQWLQLDNSQFSGPPGLDRPAMGCGISQQQPAAATNARVAQLLSTLPDQTVQQLLGMLTVEAQGA